MLYAYSDNRSIPVQFVLSLSGPTDLADVSFYESKTLTPEQAAYLANRLAGSNYSLEDILKNNADFPEFREISPISYIKEDMPPLVLVQGKADDLVPYKSAERMAAAMNEAGAECDFFLFEYSGHDLDDSRDEEIRQDYFRTLISLFKEKLDLNFENA